MSIVTFRRTIVPAVWPNDLGRSSSCAFGLQVRENWQYVPESFDEICDWAYVTAEGEENEQSSSWGRRYLVYDPLMLPDDRRGSAVTVVVVVQGFLGDFNITPLGNWDKNARTASSAVQYVTLESGGANDTFHAQVVALRNLRAFIAAKAGAELEERHDGDERIVLERPVFTKVRATGPPPVAVRLGDVSDPGGRARKLASQWVVNHIIRTGARRANGQNMGVAAASFKRGEFVEVSVYADIQVVRRHKRTGTVIKFAMTELVRLWSAEEANARFSRTDVSVGTVQPKVVTVPSVFKIGGSAEGVMEVE